MGLQQVCLLMSWNLSVYMHYTCRQPRTCHDSAGDRDGPHIMHWRCPASSAALTWPQSSCIPCPAHGVCLAACFVIEGNLGLGAFEYAFQLKPVHMCRELQCQNLKFGSMLLIINLQDCACCSSAWRWERQTGLAAATRPC